MEASGNLEALVERVLERASEEAAAVVDRAGKAAERQVEQAEAQARERREAAESVVREDVARRRHSAEAEARQSERRAVMNAREAAVQDVFSEALKAMAAITDDDVRRELLGRLVAEGIASLGAKSVRVRLNKAERALVAADFPSEFDGVPLTIDEETVDVHGGAIVTDDSGRVVFENTFEARLDRSRERLRRRVADALKLRDGEEAQ